MAGSKLMFLADHPLLTLRWFSHVVGSKRVQKVTNKFEVSFFSPQSLFLTDSGAGGESIMLSEGFCQITLIYYCYSTA